MIKFSTKNGIKAAMTNKTTPIMVTFLSLSIIPEINNKTPKNPKITGMMCENISVPVAILSRCMYKIIITIILIYSYVDLLILVLLIIIVSLSSIKMYY